MKQFMTFSKTIRIRMLLNFFSVFTQTMVMPFTVVYFSKSIGSAMTTAMILVIGIISMIGYLIGGRATDHFGRKVIIILSEIVTGIGFIVICFFDYIPTFYVTPILIAFSLVYFFQSAANPAYSALIIDSSEASERKLIYTYFMWFSSVAFSLGTVIGGFFFENHSAFLFLIVGATAFVSSLCTYFLIIEQPLPQLNHSDVVDKATKDERIKKNTRRLNMMVFLHPVYFYIYV
ncbi:MFS family permease [Sporosarcina luteola]|nr:MFS family permease [Sporosarcina luteola]